MVSLESVVNSITGIPATLLGGEYFYLCAIPAPKQIKGKINKQIYARTAALERQILAFQEDRQTDRQKDRQTNRHSA